MVPLARGPAAAPRHPPRCPPGSRRVDALDVLPRRNRAPPRDRGVPHPRNPAGLADELGIAAHVTVTTFVDDERLRALYAEASAFAFLSEYEGFGLTPLEALAAGVPPVVLDTVVAREVYGAAAGYVAAPDAGLVADALTAMLTEPEHRNRVLEAAPAVLARYRWADAAAATLRAIEDAGR